MQDVGRGNGSRSQHTISASACSSRELSRRSSDTINEGSLRESLNFSETSEQQVRPEEQVLTRKQPAESNQSGLGDSSHYESPQKEAQAWNGPRRAYIAGSGANDAHADQPIFGHFASGPRQMPSRMEPSHQVGAFSPLNQSRGSFDLPKLHTMDIAEFYKEEREKLNVWTYLFSNLTRSVRLMLTMCELEGKSEFCQGVIDMLGHSVKDFEALSHKIKLEEDSSGKLCAWDINQKTTTGTNLNLMEEYKNYAQDITEEEELEFKLLNQMVSSGRMSFYEAIVLIIRERALLIEEDRQNAQFALHNPHGGHHAEEPDIQEEFPETVCLVRNACEDEGDDARNEDECEGDWKITDERKSYVQHQEIPYQENMLAHEGQDAFPEKDGKNENKENECHEDVKM